VNSDQEAQPEGLEDKEKLFSEAEEVPVNDNDLVPDVGVCLDVGGSPCRLVERFEMAEKLERHFEVEK